MTRNACATGLSPERVSNNPVVIEDYHPFWPEPFESLRSHREDARAYASPKRELARKFGNDREAYTMAKSEFVESIVRASAGEETLSNLAVSPAARQA